MTNHQNRDIPPTEWRWPHFSRDEMKTPDTGECRMNTAFLDLLERIRQNFGLPMPVTSGYRSPEHNVKVSHTGDHGPHTTGCAVDVSVRGHAAYELIRIALAYGITGLGVSQKGDKRFIHLDTLEAPDFPRPGVWSY